MTNWYSKADWQQTAGDLREEQESCRNCGLSNEEHIHKNGCGLHVHHMIRREYFEAFLDTENVPEKAVRDMANDKRNLVVLCASCHRKIEKHAVKEQAERLNVDNPLDVMDVHEKVKKLYELDNR